MGQPNPWTTLEVHATSRSRVCLATSWPSPSPFPPPPPSPRTTSRRRGTTTTGSAGRPTAARQRVLASWFSSAPAIQQAASSDAFITGTYTGRHRLPVKTNLLLPTRPRDETTPEQLQRLLLCFPLTLLSVIVACIMCMIKFCHSYQESMGMTAADEYFWSPLLV